MSAATLFLVLMFLMSLGTTVASSVNHQLIASALGALTTFAMAISTAIVHHLTKDKK